MSDQWEVVGRKKDRSNKAGSEKQVKEKKSEFKVEDVLSTSQIKTIYGQKKANNKENQKPPQEKAKPQTNGAAKKPAPKKQDKPKKTPKLQSIDAALNSLNAVELNELFNKNKSLCPDTPMVWLKEIAQYLNVHLHVDIQDPIFSAKPESFPYSAVPTTIKNVMEKAIKQTSNKNIALFFDITLTSMANDMNKNQHALGHKLFLQYIANNYPTCAINNINKFATLRQSYQNQQNIGLSIIWVLGQAGLKDLSVGLKVFEDFMFPLIEKKNYSRFITKYLCNLIKRFSADGSITKEQYLFLTNYIFSNRKNTDLNKEMLDSVKLLNKLVMRGKNDKHNMLVEPFLKKIDQTTHHIYRIHLCHLLVEAIEKDTLTLGTWMKLYKKNLPASALLLQHIEQNSKKLSKILNQKQFREHLKSLSATHDEMLAKKQNEDGLQQCINITKKLTNKMSKKSQSTKSPLKLLSFLIVTFCGLVIFYDVKQNGGWNDSRTMKMLNQSGVCDYTHRAIDRAKEGTLWVHSRIEEKFPGVTEATVEFTTPYIELGRDMCIVASNMAGNMKNAIVAKIPIICDTIDQYAPGLLDQTKSAANNAWTGVLYYTEQGRDYLMKEVFVGKMAPEEIKKTIFTYGELAGQKTSEYYQWVYEKVTTAIK